MKPPEFILTTHAEERLALRLQTKSGKFLKVLRKAWNSKELPNRYTQRLSYVSKERKEIILKQFMGFVFVFEFKNNQVKLITIQPSKPKHKMQIG